MRESWFVLLAAIVAQYQDGEFVYSPAELEVCVNGSM